MSRRQQGFSLIEVLAAMAIFALVALAAIMASTNHVDSLGYMQKKTFAQMAASNAMSRVSLTYPPVDGQSGIERVGDIDWHWQVEVTETQTNEVLLVTISVQEHDDERLSNSSDAQVWFTLNRYMGPQT